MSLKHGILGLLTHSSMSGYDLMKAFNRSLKFFWYAQTSQIYRELEAMEKSLWIGTEETSQRGHLVKTIYTITDSGQEELSRWLLERPEDRSGGKNPFLLRLFFQSKVGADSMRELVERRKIEAEANAAELREVLGSIIPEMGGKEKDKLAVLCWREAAEYGLSQYEAEINWAEACLARIETEKGE
jgi:DNA-binding PadR family transcriptional regulator